jgi:hypothetical protein
MRPIRQNARQERAFWRMSIVGSVTFLSLIRKYENKTKSAGEVGPSVRINGFECRLKLDANRPYDRTSPGVE